MKHVAEDKLQFLMEVFLIQQFEVKNCTENPEVCQCILQALLQAMKLPNPAQYCWSFLCQAVEKIFELLPNAIQVRNKYEVYEHCNWIFLLMVSIVFFTDPSDLKYEIDVKFLMIVVQMLAQFQFK